MNKQDQIDREYEFAASWCAKRGLKGNAGDALPELLSDETYLEINGDTESFAARVRAYTYALVMDGVIG